MNLHDFIFTTKKPDRYFRHIAFWLFQFVFWTFWAGIFFCNLRKTLDWDIKFFGFFILDVSYTYLIAYHFSPKYLVKKHHSKFFLSVLFLTIGVYIIYVVYRLWMFDYFGKQRDEQLLMTWYFSMNFIILGPPVVCAMFLTLKMFKNFYIKTEEKQALTKENANAELQLLKSQVHPHFLFNTLNNIYSFSLSQSPKAGSLVLKLADTMKYMMYDCEAATVPLEKELKLVRDYMGLEKVRYGNRLDMQIEIEGEVQNKMIAPLLMIPFIENCFKHGTSQMLQHPWIKLNIAINDDLFLFELGNSKPVVCANKNGKGIGLTNVQKRLALIYPDRHQLQMISTEDSFFVRMEVQLQQEPALSAAELIPEEYSPSSKTYAYA